MTDTKNSGVRSQIRRPNLRDAVILTTVIDLATFVVVLVYGMDSAVAQFLIFGAALGTLYTITARERATVIRVVLFTIAGGFLFEAALLVHL